MKVHVYFSDWETFWDKGRDKVLIWSYDNRYVDYLYCGNSFKIIISPRELEVDAFRNNYTRPWRKYIGEFDTANYPLREKGLLITRACVETGNKRLYYELAKIPAGKIEMIGKNVEELDIVLDALGDKDEMVVGQVSEDIEDIIRWKKEECEGEV